MPGRLPSTSGPRHFLIGLLAIGYGAFLAFVVFWPSPIDRPIVGMLDKAITAMHKHGVPSFIDYAFIEFKANIALFLPVGILFGLLLPLRWSALALVLGPALSALIEVVQGQVLDQRYASAYDVLSNSIGATIGVVLALTLRAVANVRDDRVIERYLAAEAVAERI